MKTLMVALPVLVCCSAYGFGGRVHIMVNVVDSMTGAPIPNMKVHGGFRNASPRWGVSAKDNSDEKVTEKTISAPSLDSSATRGPEGDCTWRHRKETI